MLYNAETWTMKAADESRIRAFEMSVLRRICGVSLRDKCWNDDIKALLEIENDVVEKIRRRRLSYFGHVSRLKSDRVPLRMLNGRIHGNRPRGRPRRKWLDAVEEDCQERHITLLQACRLTEDRRQCQKMDSGPPRRSFLCESQWP